MTTQIPHNNRRMFSQSECRCQKIQPLVNEAMAAYAKAIRAGADPNANVNYKGYAAAIDRWYDIHIAHDRRQGRSSITIADQTWPLIFTDNGHWRSPRGRFMPDRWVKLQSRPVDRLQVDRCYVQGRDGRNAIALFR